MSITFPMPPFNPTPQGWQCPVCGAVYAPTTPACFRCVGTSPPPVTTGPRYPSGCPRCGKRERGVCSVGDCPNFGSIC